MGIIFRLELSRLGYPDQAHDHLRVEELNMAFLVIIPLMLLSILWALDTGIQSYTEEQRQHARWASMYCLGLSVLTALLKHL